MNHVLDQDETVSVVNTGSGTCYWRASGYELSLV